MEGLVIIYKVLSLILGVLIFIGMISGFVFCIEVFASDDPFFSPKMIKRIGLTTLISFFLIIAVLLVRTVIVNNAKFRDGKLDCERFMEFVKAVDSESLKVGWFDICADKLLVDDGRRKK